MGRASIRRRPIAAREASGPSDAGVMLNRRNLIGTVDVDRLERDVIREYLDDVAKAASASTAVFGKKTGAGEGIRTLDPNLGKVVLYP